MQLSILIPAYQEEATIAEILTRVAAVDTESLGFEKQIVVCDDGSKDRTA
jgi:glycosyltransferase involved in cell wall biosynthesis